METNEYRYTASFKSEEMREFFHSLLGDVKKTLARVHAFPPFVAFRKNGEVHVHIFEHEDPEAEVAKAREMAEKWKENVQFYAYGFDGKLTPEGGAMEDAIFMIVGDAAGEINLAQVYTISSTGEVEFPKRLKLLPQSRTTFGPAYMGEA